MNTTAATELLAAAVIAVAAGVATAALGPQAALLIVAPVAVAAFVFLIARSLETKPARPSTGRRTSQRPAVDQARDEPPDPITLRIARVLFFIGLATVAMSAWRLPIVGMAFTETAFGAAFVFCCLSTLAQVSMPRIPPLVSAGAGIFALGGVAASLAAEASLESLISVSRAVFMMLGLAWTAAMVLRDQRRLYLAVGWWTASVAVAGVVAILGLGESAGSFNQRALGLSEHPNGLGAAAAIALIPAAMLALTTVAEFRWKRFARVVVAIVILTAVVLSGSVAGFAGACAGLLVWLSAPALAGLARIAVVIGGIALVGVASALGGVDPTERIDQVTSQPGLTGETGSGSYRLDQYNAAFNRIAADPFVGQGMARAERGVTVSDSSTLPGYFAVHGAPVAAWLESGIFGLLGLTLVFVGVVNAGWRAANAARDHHDQLLGWSLVAAMIGFAVINSSAPLWFEAHGSISAAMVLAWVGITDSARSPLTEPAESRRIAGLADSGRPVTAT